MTLRKVLGVVLGVGAVGGGLALGSWQTHENERAEALSARAAWIRQTQQDADERYDFVRGIDGRAATTVSGVRFEVGEAGLDLAERIAGWTGSLELTSLGRAGQMRAIPAGQLSFEGNASTLDRELVEERWVSGPLGMEQIVSLARRPSGHGTLVLDVNVGGDLSASAGPNGIIELRDGNDTLRARYSDIFVTDADGAPVPSLLAVADGHIELRIDDASATYPLVIDPLVGLEQAHLFASPALGADFFGNSIAFDGTNIVAGAFAADTTALNTGAAFAYSRTGTTWSAAARLVASDGAANDLFGSSVAISGNTAVVGAPRADSALTDVGQVYVFVLSGGVWTEQQRIRPAAGLASDRFGNSVAIDGDTLLVGASLADTAAGTDSGAAYVFTRTGTTWTEQTRIVAGDASASDLFGTSVALNGGTAVIGASSDGVGAATTAGSAYVFTGSGATWTLQQHLTASDVSSGSAFGASVALLGNVVAIGSPFHAGTGAVYVYGRSGTTWTQASPVTAAGVTNFGGSVALNGTNLVGSSSNGGGLVVLFSSASGTWTETGRIVAADAAVGDNFGGSVAIVADSIVAGASQDSNAGGTNAGSVYVELIRDGNGDSCTSGAACASGVCVDGVCCNSACGGGAVDCQACSVAAGAAVDGMCTMASSGSICRAAVAGGCDVAETCNGVVGTCPADVVAVVNTPCRAAMGDCDVADVCDGSTPGCADARVAAGTVCRPAGTNVTCDPAETCAASSASCPADTNTNGTSCADALACNGNEVCMTGACMAGTAPTCNDSDLCTSDMCGEPAGCAHAHIAGCCNTAADCNDNDGCTADSCSGAGGTCSHMPLTVCIDSGPIPVDAAVPGDGSVRDAGRDSGGVDANVDGGTITPASSSCGCSAAGMGTSGAAPFGLLGLALIAVGRRRRR